MPFNREVYSNLPYQADVYFDSLPQINFKQLEDYLNSCDDGESDRCEVIDSGMQEKDGLCVGGFVVTLGEMVVMALTHNVPSPAIGMLDDIPLADEMKARLKAHQSFILLTAIEGGDYAPMERTILIYKITMGLFQQGATGVMIMHIGQAFPAGLMQGLENAAQEMLDENNASFWDLLHNEGQPQQLLLSLRRATSRDGRPWAITRGAAHCGMPDLIYELTPEQVSVNPAGLFEGYFQYCLENGPVIEAGHTMGEDSRAAFRFLKAPEDLEFEHDYRPETTLMVVREMKDGFWKKFGKKLMGKG